jgi:hypothetical protein
MADLQKIKNFLDHFPGWELYAHTEPKDHSAKTKGMQKISLDEIDKFNWPAMKAWIYFTPNGDYNTKTDRKKDLADTFQCVVIDVDEDLKPREGFIEPSYVVKTMKGYHAYFMLDEKCDIETFGETITWVISGTIEFMKSDKQCKDYSRVFRVPFTKYWKDNMGEYEIQLLEENEKQKYRLDDLYNMFGQIVTSSKDYAKERSTYTKWRDMWTIMDTINTTDAGEVLSLVTGGKFEVRWWAIYEWWKKTRWYKFWKYKNLVNNFSNDPATERPKGNSYTIVKQYTSWNFKEIAFWFRDKFGIQCDDAMRQYEERVSSMKVSWTDIVKSDDGKIKWIWQGTQRLRVNRDTNTMDYFSQTEKGEKIEKFMSCILLPVGYFKVNKQDDWTYSETRIIIKMYTSRWENVLVMKPFSGDNEFKKWLMTQGISCSANKKAIKLIEENVMSADTEYEYTNSLWLQLIWDKKFFIRRWWTYVDDSWIFVDIPDMQWEQIDEPQHTNMSWSAIVDVLCDLYDWTVSYPLFLINIVLINIRYRREFGLQVPGCFVEGLRASWKTTLKNIIMKKMFGMHLGMSAGDTHFIWESIVKHYLPINVEEFRNNALRDAPKTEGLIRGMFEGMWTSKGKADWSTYNLPFHWQYVFDWQTKFSDTAAVSRNIILMCAPHKRKKESAKKKLPENCMGNVLDIFSGIDDAMIFAKWYEDIREFVENEISVSGKTFSETSRTAQCYSFLVAMWRKLWLEKYEHIILSSMFQQLGRDDNNEILKYYNLVRQLVEKYKWNIMYCEWWCLVEVNLEMTNMKEENKSDIMSTFKTINDNFNKQVWWTGILYFDYDYIYANPGAWSRFRTFLSGAWWPMDLNMYEDGARETLRKLKTFLETDLKWMEHVAEQIDKVLFTKPF